jgi:hypothetical protein
MQQGIESWYRLSVDTSRALKSGFVWPEIEPGTKRREFFYTNPSDILDDDWLKLWLDRGSKITSVILFWRAAGSDHGWAHIDVNAKRYVTTCAINWAYDNGNTQMVWYDPPAASEINDREISVAPGNTHSLTFKMSDLNEINRCHIGLQPTLVRTNIPHTVLVGDSNRWGISMRFGGRYQTWDDAVAELSSNGGQIVGH